VSSDGDPGVPSADPALGPLMQLLGVRSPLPCASWKLPGRGRQWSSAGACPTAACSGTGPDVGPGDQRCPPGLAPGVSPGPWEVVQEVTAGEPGSVAALLGCVPGLGSPEDVLSRLIPACVGCPVGPALETHPLSGAAGHGTRAGGGPPGWAGPVTGAERAWGRQEEEEPTPCALPEAYACGYGASAKGVGAEGALGSEGAEGQEEEHFRVEQGAQEESSFPSSASSPPLGGPGPHSCPDKADSFLEPGGVATPALCASAFCSGYSLAIRGLARRLRPVGRVCRALARLFGQASVGANLSLTPPGGSRAWPSTRTTTASSCASWRGASCGGCTGLPQGASTAFHACTAQGRARAQAHLRQLRRPQQRTAVPQHQSRSP